LKSGAALEKTVCQMLKRLNSYHVPEQFSLRGLFTNVHSILVHSQNTEITKMSINSQMDKQNIVQPHNAILFSHKKEQIHG
jgi:glycine/serine hydroxymethyltransferase